MTTRNGEDVSDEKITVLISNAGTYFFEDISGCGYGGLGYWKWKGNTEAWFCYSEEGSATCDGTIEVEVRELTENRMVTFQNYGEGESLQEFVAVTSSK